MSTNTAEIPTPEAKKDGRIIIGYDDALKLREEWVSVKRAALNAKDEQLRIARHADNAIKILDKLITEPTDQS